MRLLFFVGLIVISPLLLKAQISDNFYLNINSLFHGEKLKQTDNLSKYESIYLEHYTNYYHLISFQSVNDYNKFQIVEEQLFNQLNQQKASQTIEEIKLNMMLHQVIVEAIFAHNLQAAFNLYRLNKQNQALLAKYPLSVEGQKTSAILNIILSQTPSEYRFWSNLVGLEGNLDEGFNQLKSLNQKLNNPMGKQIELVLYESFLQFRFSKNSNAYFLDFNKQDHLLSYPPVLYIAYLGAIKNKIQIDKLNILSTTQSFPLLNYAKGKYYLNHLNTLCINEFETYRKNFQGEAFKTDTYLRLAWNYLIANDTMNAYEMHKNASSSSAELTSSDKQAKEELLTLKNTPVLLIKSRLLYDAGDYFRSLAVINSMEQKCLINKTLKQQYYYQKARIQESLQLTTEALINYQLSLSYQENHSKSYYGTMASICIAQIYISKKEPDKAGFYLQIANKYNTNSYKSDFDSQIKDLQSHLSAE